MYKVILWGCGERTSNILRYGLLKSCKIMGIVDKNYVQDEFMGFRVISPDDMIQSLSDELDYIIISNQYFGEIIDYCLQKGLNWEKLVITENVIEPILQNRYKPMEFLAPELYEKQKNHRWRLVKLFERDIYDKMDFLGQPEFSNDIYRQDYFRFRTFELCAALINTNRVPGDVAELGVFKGNFAKLINQTFASKRLYLFDTFEGFDMTEAAQAVSLGRVSDEFIQMFRETSIDQVMEKMKIPEQVTICRGYFPNSIPQDMYSHTFAFVSIDVDLQKSTYEGLKFFYPRLNEGGMIFIHDYSTISGIDTAVEDYEKENKLVIKKVPLADRSGTLVIVK